MKNENHPPRMTLARALASAQQSEDGLYGVLLEHGSLELGFYRPQAVDEQQPHDRDEVYIVASGHGEFQCGDARREFEAGEALFVPAGVEHRFSGFSEDFAAWVIFYGPSGGEADRAAARD